MSHRKAVFFLLGFVLNLNLRLKSEQSRDASPARRRRQAGDGRGSWVGREGLGKSLSQALPRQPLVRLQAGERLEDRRV